MWKSYLQARENDTVKSTLQKKVAMKVKRIVNVDIVYIVHHVKL